MSGLGQVLLSRGITVSGSDPSTNEATARLISHGARIYRTQEAENLQCQQPDLVVVTAAIGQDNPELIAAHALGIPVVTRADFLGRLMDEFKGPRIAVAGTHGKTTTTAMVAEILIAAGLDPTVLVGGEYAPIGGNVRVGQSEVFLTEACEAYDSFLSLHPTHAIITNVEADHLDHYGDEAGVFAGFRKFIEGMPFGGMLALCGDDPGCQKLLNYPGGGFQADHFFFGIDAAKLYIRAVNVRTEGRTSCFDVVRSNRQGDVTLGEIVLNVPGRHNVLNALGAILLSLTLKIPCEQISEGLGCFVGTERRFDALGEREGVLVVDDYAHHPTEIRATLAAARQAYPDRRLIAVFQPHLYSRTRDFMTEFAEELAKADAVLLTDIYAAREKPIEGVRVADMTRLIAERAPKITLLYLPDKQDLVGALHWVARPGDVVLTMGAGDIREVGEAYLAS